VSPEELPALGGGTRAALIRSEMPVIPPFLPAQAVLASEFDGTGRRETSMNKTILFALGAGLVLVTAAVMARPSAPSRDGDQAVPTESPSFDEDCYEWKYPSKDECGALSGTTECKAEPTIESAADEDKREKCKPTKGELCLCD